MSRSNEAKPSDVTSNTRDQIPELVFRYSTDQVLEFARFMNFIYERQTSVLDDLLKVVIVRNVGESHLSHGRGCSATSLSEALKIPRETVRRKCEALVRDGWLLRDGKLFHPGPSIDKDILDIVDGNIDRPIATVRKIQSLAD